MDKITKNTAQHKHCYTFLQGIIAESTLKLTLLSILHRILKGTYGMLTVYSDDYFMEQALREARKAEGVDEVPVGAVIVCNNQIVARAYNQTQLLQDVTAHAEILAITSASTYLANKYLKECTLYVTTEPCVMCAGALYWSQISRVVYGTSDEKRGFMRFGKELLHPATKLEFGVKHDECAALMKSFFKKKRHETQE